MKIFKSIRTQNLEQNIHKQTHSLIKLNQQDPSSKTLQRFLLWENPENLPPKKVEKTTLSFNEIPERNVKIGIYKPSSVEQN
jgi:hypothetical protein